MFPIVKTVPLFTPTQKTDEKPNQNAINPKLRKTFVNHLATEKDPIKFFVTITLYKKQKTIYEWFSGEATYKDIYDYIDFTEKNKVSSNNNNKNYFLFEINNDNSETLLKYSDTKLSGSKIKKLVTKSLKDESMK